jgi:hypothetical protein
MPSAGLTTGGGGPGNDVLRASASDGPLVELLGGPGADELLGGRGADSLNPGVDDDRDVVDGGGGRDRVDYAGRQEPLRIDLAGLDIVDGDVLRSIEDLTGGNGDDVLRGGPARESIGGGPGSDTVRGGAGDDGLDGGGGDDDLAGGPGDDRIWDWSGRDSLSGGPGDDRLDPWTFQEAETAERKRLSCGSGRDILHYPDTSTFFPARDRQVPADCELLDVDASMLAPFRALPRVEDGVASWSLLCTRATWDDRVCPTTFELRAGGALAGRATVRLRPKRREALRVRLNEAGRRAVRRGGRLAVALRMRSYFGFIGGGRPRNFEIDLPG